MPTAANKVKKTMFPPSAIDAEDMRVSPAARAAETAVNMAMTEPAEHAAPTAAHTSVHNHMDACMRMSDKTSRIMLLRHLPHPRTAPRGRHRSLRGSRRRE